MPQQRSNESQKNCFIRESNPNLSNQVNRYNNIQKDQFGETFNKYTKENKENSPQKNFKDPPLSMREQYIMEKNAKKA